MTGLVAKAIEAATGTQPWSGVVQCSIEDYFEAGLQGNETRIPVDPGGPISEAESLQRAYLMASDRIRAEGEALRRRAHIIRLVPTIGVPNGTLLVGEMRDAVEAAVAKLAQQAAEDGAMPDVFWHEGVRYEKEKS